MSSPTVSVDEVETRTERKSVSFLRNSKYIYMCVCIPNTYVFHVLKSTKKEIIKKKKIQKIKIL